MRQTSNKTLPRFLYLFFAEMGKVCEICVLPGFTFPRTCRRPSFEFSPSPPLPSEIARSFATSYTLILVHTRKFFSLLAFFLPASGVYYHARTTESRDAPTPRSSLSFVTVKRVICNAAGKFVENPFARKFPPTVLQRRERERERDFFSLLLLPLFLFRHFAPHRLDNSHDVFFPTNFDGKYSEKSAVFFIANTSWHVSRDARRWIVIARIMT